MTLADEPPASPPLPRLAFVYHPRSFAALAIVEAARGVCELVWLVDTGDARVGSTVRLLARLGSVVDIAGMSPRQVADALSAQRIDGVLALADDLLEWTASLAARLGLPFLSERTALRLTDKYAQRAALRAAGLAAPGSWVVNAATSKDVWTSIETEARVPLVIKPRQGEGSRNTLIVGSVDAASAVVTDSAREPEAADRDWVIEEYIADIDHAVCGSGFANYVSVESYLVDGVPTHLAVNGRTPPATPFRETGFFIPADVASATANELAATAGRAIIALGATLGCFHTEIKLTPTGPVVIEVNGRIGGGVPELLELTTGLDFLRIALRIAIGEKVAVEPLDFRGVSYLFYVQAPEDVVNITAVTGLDAVAAMEGVTEVILNRGPGSHVNWRDGNHGHVFSVLGHTSDYDGLRTAISRVAELSSIEGD